MHNLYPKLYHCASWQYARTRPTPPVAFIRSGWDRGASVRPGGLGGDPTTAWGFDGLESAVKQALSLGTSGIGRWGSDIGGFFAIFNDQLTPEMLSRWIEFGAVSGVMRTQANGFQVGVTERAQIFDADNATIWRRYSKLRTQLYPYLQAADSNYLRTGMPIMRHLALTNPGDPIATGQEDEFMFGPDLLAAPVVTPGSTSRQGPAAWPLDRLLARGELPVRPRVAGDEEGPRHRRGTLGDRPGSPGGAAADGSGGCRRRCCPPP